MYSAALRPRKRNREMAYAHVAARKTAKIVVTIDTNNELIAHVTKSPRVRRSV